jgi:ornithine carbamoyltransferase
MNLVAVSDLTERQIREIWSLVDTPGPALAAQVAWSFEGNGIRTRTTFVRAFSELGMPFTELPNLLKTGERVTDLAGYLDPFYDLYVIRESNHARLQAFAEASARPVINAMSSQGHPCEVLTDAFYLEKRFENLRQVHLCLWGPTTNVFRSWHDLAKVMGFKVTQVCEAQFHEELPSVVFQTDPPSDADVVITDAWPTGAEQGGLALTAQHLAAMGDPVLLPTPPFTIGRELALDPATHPHFVGYAQKRLLLPVQKAILRYTLGA